MMIRYINKCLTKVQEKIFVIYIKKFSQLNVQLKQN